MVQRLAAGGDGAVIASTLRQIYARGLSDGRKTETRPAKIKKQDIVADLLRRPQGCMSWEILEATGWPTVNIKRFAHAAGLRVRKERVAGNCHRFFGEPMDQATRASAA